MPRVLIATVRLLEFLEGAGHFWVYMQYAHALRRLGCEVFVLDSFTWSDETPDEQRVGEFLDRMARYGLEDHVLVAANGNGRGKPSANGAYFGMGESEVPDLLADVDLLLNFNYHLGQDFVSAVRRSALVDIDPGLLQFWISSGMISPAVHDSYFTIGETVGRRPSPIPDCGIDWMPIRPPVCLDLWPSTYDAGAEVFTTVSSWWGKSDYVGTRENFYDNTKRKAFLDFIDLPHHTDQPLEVALFFAEADARDRRKLEDNGWRVRHSQEIAASPESYRAYIQASRGEFSWRSPPAGSSRMRG